MKIIVFDVPAENGGALTILEKYHMDASKETANEWLFIVSTPKLNKSHNVEVKRFPWVKKSWFHRLFFDLVISPKLVRKYKADRVLSLQNIIVPFTKIKQTVYLHQSLPYTSKKFKIMENFKFWIYQNIIGKIITQSLIRADKVIVQANWMKKKISSEKKIDEKKIQVIPPELNLIPSQLYNDYDNNNVFFYPANGYAYKNHEVVVEAVKKLKEAGIKEFKVIFTLKEEENEHISDLYELVKKDNLPIEFVGELNRKEVLDYYSKSFLLFPSYIETYGLPLLEARLHKTPIISSNCEFAREVLEGYYDVEYFDPFDHRDLYEKMYNKIEKKESIMQELKRVKM